MAPEGPLGLWDAEFELAIGQAGLIRVRQMNRGAIHLAGRTAERRSHEARMVARRACRQSLSPLLHQNAPTQGYFDAIEGVYCPLIDSGGLNSSLRAARKFCDAKAVQER